MNIVGTNISVNNQGSSMGTSLIKAGSILFLIEILLMILFLVTIGLSGSQLNTVVYLLIVGLVVLIVRCVFQYSVVSIGAPGKTQVLTLSILVNISIILFLHCYPK